MKTSQQKKGIIRQFSLVVYPVNLAIAIGEDLETNVNARYKPYEASYGYISFPANTAAAATFVLKTKKDNEYTTLIWIPDVKDCTVGVIAHESAHAAMEIFKYIRSQVNLEDQEPFAYLTGTIAKLTTKVYYELKDIIEKSTKKKKK